MAGSGNVVDIVTYARGKLVRGGVRLGIAMDALDTPAVAGLREAIANLAPNTVARVNANLAADHPDPSLRGVPASFFVRVRACAPAAAASLAVEIAPAAPLSDAEAKSVDVVAARLGVKITPGDVDAEIEARWRRIEEPVLLEMKFDDAERKEALALWLTDSTMRSEIDARLRRSLALLKSAPKSLDPSLVDAVLTELAKVSRVSVADLKATLKKDKALAAATERIILERASLAQLVKKR